MPDNVRPPRSIVDADHRPSLGAQVIMREIEQIATRQRLQGYRVAYKRNAKGEHVVALLFPPQPR
jgi:hypothetical protein